MKTLAALIVVILVTANSWAADDPIVPVHEEPRHRLLRDTRNWRILELLIPAGDTTLYHTHSSPIFYITLNDSALRTQQLGEEWQVLPVRNLNSGTVRFNDSYASKPVTHRVNNIGTEAVRSILILNERDEPQTDEEYGDRSLPGFPEIDSKWFRQSRIVLQGGETLVWDGARERFVFVLISDTHVTFTVRNDERFTFGMTTSGSFESINAGAGFEIRNHSPEQATIIAVAVR